ncbi:uncharacterized protein LOC105698597 [Orussus abietinus]|uniref:uncharacterized protein LOC105698597 n=1 Tax=Orussus abietinus TaxID=222816 RepID=UPI00062626E2|nr:uncharacterized protein LOC105698597 [Orussus abietinus]
MKIACVVALTCALAAVGADQELMPKQKRGVALFGQHGFDAFGAGPSFGSSGWAPNNFAPLGWGPSPSSDLALGQIQLQATHNVAVQALKDSSPITPGIAYPPEVVRAVQQAKEANHNVLVAQHRVGEAKQAALLQQKIALAKEAAAREATQRSEEISAHAQADARASAQQLVALQQKLATLKEAVAAAQRVAAAREAAAAAAIQRNAADTAAELRKQDVDKQITRSEEEAKEKDIIAAKQNAIANALQNAASEKSSYHPWG